MTTVERTQQRPIITGRIHLEVGVMTDDGGQRETGRGKRRCEGDSRQFSRFTSRANEALTVKRQGEGRISNRILSAQ